MACFVQWEKHGSSVGMISHNIKEEKFTFTRE
jgi:hypothetical protein